MTLLAVWIAGFIAAVFAGIMVFSRSLYVSAVCLLAVLLQTGLIFVLRGAALLGALQVMIYAGAVMVLVVITIMATGGEPEEGFERFAAFSFPRRLAVAGFLAAAAEIGLALSLTLGPSAPTAPADPGLTAAFAAALFKSYAVATEAVTLLMFLAALAVLPAREDA